MVDAENERISLKRQCQLLGVNRSGLYYRQRGGGGGQKVTENLELLRRVAEIYTQSPFYGSRRVPAQLRREGFRVNHKRVERLMKVLGLAAIYPAPKTTSSCPEHRKYPYLLRDLSIVRANQVWASDSTYIRLSGGFVYLVAILDWYSRRVLSWRLSNTMDVSFCVAAVSESLAHWQPEIFNSDQGSQYTSLEMTGLLSSRKIKISMDGRGRCHDNIFIERLWRTVKYEEVYLKEYQSVWAAEDGLAAYFKFYNERRLHQSLSYRTPTEVFEESIAEQKNKAEKEKLEQ